MQMRLGEGGFVPAAATSIGNGWFRSSASNSMTARHRAAGDVKVVHSLRIDCHRVTFTDAEWDTFLAGVSDGQADRP